MDEPLQQIVEDEMGSLCIGQQEDNPPTPPACVPWELSSLPAILWDKMLALAGPAGCASFGCVCSEGRSLAERCSVWRTIRGVGDLTVRSPCGLECSYVPPVIPSPDPEYGSNVPPGVSFNNPYWIGWKSSLPEQAIVQGQMQARREAPRPLTAPEVIALVRRCPNVEELGLRAIDNDDEDEETYDEENLTEIFDAISESRWRLKRVILPGMGFLELRDSSASCALRDFLEANAETVEVLVRGGSYVPYAPGLLEIFEGLEMPELWYTKGWAGGQDYPHHGFAVIAQVAPNLRHVHLIDYFPDVEGFRETELGNLAEDLEIEHVTTEVLGYHDYNAMEEIDLMEEAETYTAIGYGVHGIWKGEVYPTAKYFYGPG